MVKTGNVANTDASKVAKFLAFYEGPYRIKKEITRNIYILSNTETEREKGLFHAVFAERRRKRPPT